MTADSAIAAPPQVGQVLGVAEFLPWFECSEPHKEKAKERLRASMRRYEEHRKVRVGKIVFSEEPAIKEQGLFLIARAEVVELLP